MKKYLLLLSVIVLGLSACKKGDVVADQAAIDDAKIQAYIAANYKTTNFIKDASGIYYAVIKTGTGAYPTATSTVQVSYTGKLLNGSQFDQSTHFLTPLSSTIKGWQIGLLHINSGTLPNTADTAGRLLLIVPSALAYGTTGSGSIEANSVLVFTIDLLGIS